MAVGKVLEQGFDKLPYVTEQLKVSKSAIMARVNIITGKEDDIWVFYSPSLEVSGYGKTKSIAEKSFNHNMKQFCDDLHELKQSEQRKVLRQLGWRQQKYATKQFSKAYVDNDGILQNLEHAELQSLQTVA
tara:strand:+ start:2816 stop:3208 length:393 start_codon:yes stop_codon:yes gene_type:complete